MADWSDLPQELLRLIAQRLDTCFDVVRFRSICSSWRSSTPPVSRQKSLRCPLPPDEGGFGDDCYLSRSCVYLLRSPPSDNDNLQDSSGGCWLFKITEKEDGASVLHNPFCSLLSCYNCNPLYRGILLDSLNRQIDALGCGHMACYTALFKIFDFDEFEGSQYVPVAFMRLGIGNGDFAVLGVLSFDKLAVFRSVDKQWRQIEDTRSSFEAIASFNGKFYVVDCTGTTLVIRPSLEASYFQNSRPPAKDRKLVQSGNELFLVEVFSNMNEREGFYYDPEVEAETTWVEVFKVDEDKNEWDKVQDLGGYMLFISGNVSFSCTANQIPGVSGSSIFYLRGGCSFDDVLVFNLKDRSCRYLKNIPDFLKLFWPPLNQLFLDLLV